MPRRFEKRRVILIQGAGGVDMPVAKLQHAPNRVIVLCSKGHEESRLTCR